MVLPFSIAFVQRVQLSIQDLNKYVFKFQLLIFLEVNLILFVMAKLINRAVYLQEYDKLTQKHIQQLQSFYKTYRNIPSYLIFIFTIATFRHSHFSSIIKILVMLQAIFVLLKKKYTVTYESWLLICIPDLIFLSGLIIIIFFLQQPTYDFDNLYLDFLLFAINLIQITNILYHILTQPKTVQKVEQKTVYTD